MPFFSYRQDSEHLLLILVNFVALFTFTTHVLSAKMGPNGGDIVATVCGKILLQTGDKAKESVSNVFPFTTLLQTGFRSRQHC